MNSNNRPPEAGGGIHAARFTLIEIMIVVVLLGIVAAIVAPSLGGRADLKLSAAARKMLADFQYAQNLAITSQQNSYIQFQTGQYTIARQSGGSFTTLMHPIEKKPFTVTIGSGTSDPVKGVTFAKPVFNSSSTMGFDTVGSPIVWSSSTAIPLTQAVLVNLTCQGQSVVLRVEPYTGEVTIP